LKKSSSKQEIDDIPIWTARTQKTEDSLSKVKSKAIPVTGRGSL
jgi:hypothetical protein